MPSSCISRCWTFVALIGCIGSVDLRAQSDCNYDQCALRVRHRLFVGTDVVQGQRADKVGGYSFLGFAPYLPMLAEGPDSVRLNYGAFRTGNNSGAVLEMVGLAAMLGSLIVVEADGPDELAIGLAFGGVVPLFWGAIRRVQARDRLSRAIWWYNRTLR